MTSSPLQGEASKPGRTYSLPGYAVGIKLVVYICPTLNVSLSFSLKYTNSVGFSQCHKLCLLFWGSAVLLFQV